MNASSPIIGSPLHMACSEGISNRLPILKLLLEKGANPNLVIIGDDGSPIKPPIGEYLSSNEEHDVEVVNLFLKHGAEVRVGFVILTGFKNSHSLKKKILLLLYFDNI